MDIQTQLIKYLCQLISEECNEVGQRASKLSRFGVNEVQPGQPLDNFERLRAEKADFLVVYELLLVATGRADKDAFAIDATERKAKHDKIIKFSWLSVENGMLDAGVVNALTQLSKKMHQSAQ